VGLPKLLDRLVQARGIGAGQGQLDSAEQPSGLRERRIQPHGLPRLFRGLVADVQVPKELGILEADDRVVRKLFDDLAVEIQGLAVAAVADRGPGLQVDLPGVQEGVRRVG
jgi:hypothetical protein